MIQPEAQAEIKMPRQSAPIKKKDVAPAVRAVCSCRSLTRNQSPCRSLTRSRLPPRRNPTRNRSPMPEPDPEPVPMPESDSVSRPGRYTGSARGAVASPRPAAQRVTPQEEQTTQKLDELRALLEQINGSAAAPVKEKQPETESARPTLVFAQEHQPEAQPTRSAFPEKKTEPSALGEAPPAFVSGSRSRPGTRTIP